MIKRVILILGIVAFAFCYAPPPEPASAQFSGQAQWARTASTGSVNAQSVALANYSLQVGVPVTFIVGTSLTNTDAMTLNINGTGAISVKRMTNVGIDNFVGGEFVATNQATVVYDGTQYRLTGVVFQVGIPQNFRGAVDAGYVPEDGRCLSSITYPALFQKIGVTYGTCGANLYAVPDSRGRVDASLDNIGTGPASRITNCSWVALGAICGNQNTSLTNVNQMPPYTPGGTTTFTPSGTISFTGNPAVGQANGTLDTGGTTAPINPINFQSAVSAQFTGAQISPALTGTPVGSSSPIPALPPMITSIRAIKL